MPDDDILRPSKKYRPTEASLDLAERIARAQGVAFDREATRKLGGDLHGVMFADLAHVLGIEPKTIRFHSGVYPAARAFTARSGDGTPAVVLDMIFDHWVLSLTHMVCICTFTLPDHDERQQITDDVTSLFELFSFSGNFEESRRRMARYLLHPEYQKGPLNIASALARAMVVFVLCHELAHVHLDHLASAEPDAQTELQADARAVDYFRRVVAFGRTDRNTHIHVDPKMAGAPLILSMILELYEAWLVSRGTKLGDVSRHPPASLRTAQLHKMMDADLNETALEIAVGARHAIEDIAEWLGLPSS